MFRLLLHPNVEKQLHRIPKDHLIRIANAIKDLGNNPCPEQSKHIGDVFFRLRVGEYRIVYAVFYSEHIVFIGKVVRRNEKTYRDIASSLASAHNAVEDIEDQTTDLKDKSPKKPKG